MFPPEWVSTLLSHRILQTIFIEFIEGIRCSFPLEMIHTRNTWNRFEIFKMVSIYSQKSIPCQISGGAHIDIWSFRCVTDVAEVLLDYWALVIYCVTSGCVERFFYGCGFEKNIIIQFSSFIVDQVIKVNFSVKYFSFYRAMTCSIF